MTMEMIKISQFLKNNLIFKKNNLDQIFTVNYIIT